MFTLLTSCEVRYGSDPIDKMDSIHATDVGLTLQSAK